MPQLRTFCFLLLIASSLLSQAPRGTVPRADATGYAAHTEQDGVKLGASALSHKDVKKIFAVDLNQCCMVVEVAVYPAKNGRVNISLDDFTLRERGKDTGVQPARADVLAARLQVPPDRDPRAGVSTESRVGYERGTTVDPRTGLPTKGTSVYESQTVSVGVPIGGGKPQSPEAASESDRRALESGLKERMLPETSTTEPVAGYLYFTVTTKPKGGYELVYTVNEKKIVLPLK
jgi:predicted Rdx family selenoprotein